MSAQGEPNAAAGCALIVIVFVVLVALIAIGLNSCSSSASDPNVDEVCSQLNHNSSEKLVAACLQQGYGR